MKKKLQIKHKVLISVLCLFTLCVIHQIIYLYFIQPNCHKKLTEGKDLNWYETVCVLQTHTNLWLVGWLIEPNTAEACFCKQFHCRPLHLFPYILEDDVVIKAKQSLTSNGQQTKLAWKTVNTRAPILLNGTTLKRVEIPNDKGEGIKIMWEYTTPMDFAPGMFNVGFIPISELSFDYLEKKGILNIYTDVRYQEDNIKKPWYVRLMEKPLPISAK